MPPITPKGPDALKALYNATVEAQKLTFIRGAEAISPTTAGRALGGVAGAAVAGAITIEAAKLTAEQAQAAADTFNLMKSQGHSNLAAAWQATPEGIFTAGFAVGTGLAAIAVPAALHAAGRRMGEVARYDEAVQKLLEAEAAKAGGDG